MPSVEKRLDLVEKPEALAAIIQPDERQRLLTLAEALSEPSLSLELRLEIAAKMRFVLTRIEIYSAFNDQRWSLVRPPLQFR